MKGGEGPSQRPRLERSERLTNRLGIGADLSRRCKAADYPSHSLHIEVWETGGDASRPRQTQMTNLNSPLKGVFSLLHGITFNVTVAHTFFDNSYA